MAEDTTQPIAEDTTQPIGEDTTQPISEDTTQPMAEDTTQPMAEDTTQPMAEKQDAEDTSMQHSFLTAAPTLANTLGVDLTYVDSPACLLAVTVPVCGTCQDNQNIVEIIQTVIEVPAELPKCTEHCSTGKDVLVQGLAQQVATQHESSVQTAYCDAADGCGESASFDLTRPPFELTRPSFELTKPPFELTRPSFELTRPPFELTRPAPWHPANVLHTLEKEEEEEEKCSSPTSNEQDMELTNPLSPSDIAEPNDDSPH
jgi:hypothetical protein